MEIGIGIITYRGHERVGQLMESICRRSLGALERSRVGIVLHDDGSPGGLPPTVKSIEQRVRDAGFASWEATASPVNRGIAPAWNTATRLCLASGARIVVLLNDDVLVGHEWLAPMIYFLDNNPHAGTASWLQFFFDPLDVPAILDDPDTATPRQHLRQPGQIIRDPQPRWPIGEARPGRVGCPAGSAFAFRRDMWERTDGFPENFRSFHEESAFSFQLVEKGYPAYSISWPIIWHQWSATFNACPELDAHGTMRRSRELFCQRFGVPPEFAARPFDHTHPRLMHSVGAFSLKWLAPDGPRECVDPPCSCVRCVYTRQTGVVPPPNFP